MPNAADPPDRRPARRDFIHIAVWTTAAGGVALLAWPLIDQMNPPVNTPRPIDTFDLGKVPLGQQVVFLGRARPLFIRHRTSSEIAAAVRDDHLPLAEPQADADRVRPGHAQWLVVIGVCTYDGCTPTFAEGDFGGWMCPCCGSQFDTAGRARIGPAQGGSRERFRGGRNPKNLVVPDYEFLGEHTVRLLPT